MIDFACKSIKVEELIRCSFQLSKTDYEVLVKLMDSEKDTKKLAEEMGLDRSTVQKSVSKLRNQGLIKRRQYNLSSGGYRYVYTSKEKEEIKKEVRSLIDKWSSSAKEAIQDW